MFSLSVAAKTVERRSTWHGIQFLYKEKNKVDNRVQWKQWES